MTVTVTPPRQTNLLRRRYPRMLGPTLVVFATISVAISIASVLLLPPSLPNLDTWLPNHSFGMSTSQRHHLTAIAGAATVLQIWPLYGVHRNHSDAVFGMATGQDLPEFVRFVQSLLTSGYSGDIVLGVDPHNKLKDDVKGFLIYHARYHHLVVYEVLVDCIQPNRGGWTYCQVRNMFANRETGEFQNDSRPYRHLSQLRFDYFWAWSIQYSTQSRIMVLDTRDLYVQRDPFPFLNRSKISSTLLTFAESGTLRLGTERYNRAWMRRAYGDEAWEQFSDKLILCAGTTAGGQPAIEAYTRTMITQLDSTNCTAHGCDQGHHNYIVWSGILQQSEEIEQVEVQRQGEGLVNTLALLYHHGGHSLRSNGIIDHHTGAVLNNDGSTAPIVHQFDRDPELVNIVKGLTKQYMDEWKKRCS